MEKLQPMLFSLALVMAASFALSCGATPTPPPLSCGASLAPSSGGGNPATEPQSITIIPATADAQDCPDQQVQFTATGHYSSAPFTVTPQPATWSACLQHAPTSEVSVSATGLAQCATGADGTYTILAVDPGNCLAVGPCGVCDVVGTAQLTCP